MRNAAPNFYLKIQPKLMIIRKKTEKNKISSVLFHE